MSDLVVIALIVATAPTIAAVAALIVALKAKRFVEVAETVIKKVKE